MSKILGSTVLKQILISYELAPQPAPDATQLRRFKSLLMASNYSNTISGVNAKGEKGKTVLPCCTYLRANVSPKEAKAGLRDAAKQCGLTVTRCIAAEIFEWSGIAAAKRIPDADRLIG